MGAVLVASWWAGVLALGGGAKTVDSRGLVQLNLGVVETRTRDSCCGVWWFYPMEPD